MRRIGVKLSPLLFLGVFLRIILLPYGNHIDLIINTEWGKWIFERGQLGFYTNNIWIFGWPTQLPFINSLYAFNNDLYKQLLWYFTYVQQVIVHRNIFRASFSWYFNFVDWFGSRLYQETPFTNGLLISMKIVPIISDLLLALLAIIIGKATKHMKQGLVVGALFLLLPHSWYVSALWGQYDQLATLLVLVGFLLLFFSPLSSLAKSVSPVFLVLAIQVKPYLLFLAPYYAICYLVRVREIKAYFLGALFVLGIFFVTFSPYTNLWNLTNVYSVVFNLDRYGLVNRAFNFWSFLSPFGGWSTSFKLVWISALYWGLASWLLVLIIAARQFIKNQTVFTLLFGIFIVSAGCYLFTTGMVDRYLYPAIVALGLVTIQRKNWTLLWVFICLVFFLNLQYSWGFPFAESVNTWVNQWIIRTGAFLNLSLTGLIFAQSKENLTKNKT